VDLRDFMQFTGIRDPQEFRIITRAHVIAFRDELQRRGLQGPTVRRKLAAISSLFEFLCTKHTIAANPVKGVARPKDDTTEGKTPAISDGQVRRLLAAPEGPSVKATRDRAILSMLFYHALRRAELCRLSIKDIHERRGVKHLRIYGKGEKLRYVPLHPGSLDRINEYLEMLYTAPPDAVLSGSASGPGRTSMSARSGGPTSLRGSSESHPPSPSAPLFKPIRNNRRGTTDTALTADGIYQILKFYGKKVGISVDRFGPHAARATAATNALDQGADIAKVQEWLGHANVSRSRVYDHRKTRPEDSPVFKVGY
jgi:integrase/recombinase XerD